MRRLRRTLFVLLTAALAGLALAAYLVDTHYKRWPDNGYVLDGADLTLASDDFPGFWRGVLNTTAGHDIAQALSRQIGTLERDVRLTTGIRPTPLRWSLWLGDRVLVSRKDGHWLACIRPGLLFHAAHRVLLVAHALLPKGGLEKLNNLNFVWRSGYLLVAEDAQLLRAATAAERMGDDTTPAPNLTARLSDVPPAGTSDPNSAENSWLHRFHHRLHADFTLQATEDFPLIVRVRDLEGKITPLPPIPAGFGKPANDALAEVTAQDPFLWGQIQHLGKDIISTTQCLQSLYDLHEQFAWRIWQVLGSDEFDPLDASPFRLVLFDIDPAVLPPIPRAGTGIFRRDAAWEEHPLKKRTFQMTPYDWDGTTGFLTQYSGSDFNLGCVIDGHWAFTTTQPKYMPSMLPDRNAPLETPSIFSFKVNCNQLGDRMAVVMRKACSVGLFDASVREFDVIYSPWLDAFRALGLFELQSEGPEGSDGTLLLKGHFRHEQGNKQ